MHECVFVSGLSFGVFISTAASEFELQSLCRWIGLHAQQPAVTLLQMNSDQYRAAGLMKSCPVCSAIVPTGCKRGFFHSWLLLLSLRLFHLTVATVCVCLSYFITYVKQRLLEKVYEYKIDTQLRILIKFNSFVSLALFNSCKMGQGMETLANTS